MAQIERQISVTLSEQLLEDVHREAAAAGLTKDDFVARCLENRPVVINGKTYAIAALARIDSWIRSGQCSTEQILQYIESEMKMLDGGAVEIAKPAAGANTVDDFEIILGERSE